MVIELLKELTKLNITNLEFDDLKNKGDISGYDFSIIKVKVFLEEKNSKEDNKNYKNTKEKRMMDINTKQDVGEHNQIDVYIKMIRKDRIKESIFCYWNLLYDENFKNYEESEFTSVINKVKITETESEEYKHSVLLEIKENKWGILECGSTIHLVKLAKYLNDNSTKKSKLICEWKKYIEKDNQDVLFIGIVNQDKVKNNKIF